MYFRALHFSLAYPSLSNPCFTENSVTTEFLIPNWESSLFYTEGPEFELEGECELFSENVVYADKESLVIVTESAKKYSDKPTDIDLYTDKDGIHCLVAGIEEEAKFIYTWLKNGLKITTTKDLDATFNHEKLIGMCTFDEFNEQLYEILKGRVYKDTFNWIEEVQQVFS